MIASVHSEKTRLKNLIMIIIIIGERSEPLSRVFNDPTRGIGECGSTLYVGLSGIVRNLIQKSTGWDHTFLSIFFFFFFFFFSLLGMSRAGVNTKDAMKKQIRRIHSVFSHVDP